MKFSLQSEIEKLESSQREWDMMFFIVMAVVTALVIIFT
jgi:hypothetical protein